MPSLHESHRPTDLESFIGESAIKQLRAIVSRKNFDGAAFLLQGGTGTGKTTLANIIANTFCDDPYDIEQVNGADCTVDEVRRIQSMFSLCSRGDSGYRACIVDEAHAMTPRAVQAWLTLLEPLKAHRLVFFTSTEEMTSDIFGNFTSPFADRCKVITLEPDRNDFAVRAMTIAETEDLGGAPFDAYLALFDACKGSMRKMLQEIESGKMLAEHAAA